MALRLPAEVDVVVIGGGFAGASVAAALGRADVSGLLLEREPLPGTYASGRNAGIARQVEAHPVLCKLAIEGVRRLRAKTVDGRPVLRETGGLYLLHGGADRATRWQSPMVQQGVPCELMSGSEARQRFPFLGQFNFDYALFSPTDGVVDIHALLSGLLAEAKASDFEVVTGCAADSLILQEGVVCGIRTPRGNVRTRLVVDATGAWAGHLGREAGPLQLQALRRHLFVSSDCELVPRDAPTVWDLDVGYYLRPEGTGLLLCPCDETEHPPSEPVMDPAAQDLLVEKLLQHAPGLAGVSLRRSWACLRTFAPDRLPVIGWDPHIHRLFHVSGLGGFGMTASLAIGDIAATMICGGVPDWIEAAAFSAGREVLQPVSRHR